MQDADVVDEGDGDGVMQESGHTPMVTSWPSDRREPEVREGKMWVMVE